MEALGSALVSMKKPVSSSSPTQKQDMSSPAKTTVMMPKKREEKQQIPSIYSSPCANFDEEAPAELPDLQDVSSSSSSSLKHDIVGTTGDLIRSLQELRPTTQEEEIVFDCLWDDVFEEHQTGVRKGQPKKKQTAGSIGLLAYTNDRSSDVDTPYRSKVENESCDSSKVPAASVNLEDTACFLQSRKKWMCAIIFLIFIAIAVVCVLMFVVEEKSTESYVRPLPVSSQPSLAPTTFRAITPTLSLAPSQTDTFRTMAPSVRDEPIRTITLPALPETRFTPFSQLPEAILNNLMRHSLLGYDSGTWNVPGSANNAANSTGVFWEGRSFKTIQNTNLQAISGVVRLDLNAQQWDCWVNHYQDFTWDELYGQSDIKLVFDEDGSVIIYGRDLQEAMRVFGWTEANWETPERFEYFFPQGTSRGQRPPWDELTMAEQEAATSICWNRELWNRIPLLDW